MKKLILVFTLTIALLDSFGQQLPVISQFQFNRLYYNPAYAGSNEQFSASTFFRKQWIGSIPNTPTTGMVSADAPIGTTKLGVGGYALYDIAGVTNTTEISGALSYKINVGPESYLSAGLKAGATYYQANVNQLKIWDQSDAVFDGPGISQVMPKIGFGAYYYHTNYYAGFSAPDLFLIDKQKIFTSEVDGKKTVYRNFVLMGGANIMLTNRFTLVPSIIVKYFPNSPLYVNVNAGLKLSEKIQAGVGYRTPTTFSLFGNMALNEKIKVGYAFDFNPSNFSLGNAGSHEVMLTYGLQQ